MKYAIEHVGIAVSHPLEMAEWYRDVLGFDVKFTAGNTQQAVAFLCDADGKVVLELGKIPDVVPLRTRTSHHLQFHIALRSVDPEAEAKCLVEKGARFIEKCPITRPGDVLVTLEDPWGNCIQLARRAKGKEL